MVKISSMGRGAARRVGNVHVSVVTLKRLRRAGDRVVAAKDVQAKV